MSEFRGTVLPVVTVTPDQKPTKPKGAFVTGLFDNLGGILNGAGGLVNAIKGTTPVNNYYSGNVNNDDEPKDNTLIYIGIGAAVLLVLFFALKGKK